MDINDLGPLPKVNPREPYVELAEREVRDALGKIFQQYELTPSEQFLLLAKEVQTLARMCVTSERRARSTSVTRKQ